MKVELEIQRPDGYEDVSDRQLIDWINYELGQWGSISRDNPLSDGTPLSDGVITCHIS